MLNSMSSMKRLTYLLIALGIVVCFSLILFFNNIFIFADSADIGSPSRLVATVKLENSVELNWTAPRQGQFGYRIYRNNCQPKKSFILQNKSPISENSYIQTDLKPGLYCYKVSALKHRQGRWIEGSKNKVAAKATIGSNSITPSTTPTNSPRVTPTISPNPEAVIKADYFVSTNGTDSADCSLVKPCRQIVSAITLAKNGGVIEVEEGEYRGFTLSNLKHSESKPLVIRTVKGAVLSPIDFRGIKINVFIENSSFVTIDGFGLTNGSDNRSHHAIKVVESDYLKFVNNNLSFTKESVILTGNNSHDLLIENNQTSDSLNGHGIYVSESADKVVIANNRSFNNGKSGIQVNAEKGPGQSGDGLSKEVSIRRNIIYDNKGNGLNLLGVQDSFIVNNLIVNNLATGIANAKVAAAAGPAGVKIYHNTVIMPTGSRYALQFANPNAGGNLVRNNVLYHEDGKNIEFTPLSSQNLIENDYNAYKVNTSIANRSPEKNSVYIASPIEILTNPVLPSAEQNDLPKQSILNSKGGVIEPNIVDDLKGRTRPTNQADLGAFELE